MMQQKERKPVDVYADWEGLHAPEYFGTVHSEYLRGKELFSFSYAEEWLRKHPAHHLDPELHLYAGRQYPGHRAEEGTPGLFGLFADSSPDRWGRMLMQRCEIHLAKREHRLPVTLMEMDYLLGVDDTTRMGALRFKHPGDSPFLAPPTPWSAPPLVRLRELEQASRAYERNDDAQEWIDLLVAPGSSLGGARPKASVKDEQDRL